MKRLVGFLWESFGLLIVASLAIVTLTLAVKSVAEAVVFIRSAMR